MVSGTQRTHVRRFARRRPGAAVIATLASTAAISWLVGSVGVRVARVLPNPRREPGPPAEPLVLTAADGSRIAASFWPGQSDAAPAILLVPGIGALHRKLAVNAAWFAVQGYAVLAIDLRGHGRSSPALHTFGWVESRDVHAAFAWLKTRQRGARVAVIGISMGGAACLLGPAGAVPADAFVLQAVFADIRKAVRSRIALFFGWPLAWLLEPLLSFQSKLRFGIWPARIAPLAVVTQLDRPVLVIGGGRDPFVPPAEALEFHEAAKDARGLWIAPRLGHNGISDTLGDDYRKRVLAFLRETID